MRRAIFWSVTGVALAAALAAWFVLLAPESTRLATATDAALDHARDAEQIREVAAGPKYAESLDHFLDLRKALIGKIDETRAENAARLDEWFKDMTIAPGSDRPTPEEFKRAYGFNGDKFVARIREAFKRFGAPEIREIQLVKPPFMGGELPKESEIASWQRIANIERRLIETGIRYGAVPTRRMEIESQPKPVSDPDPNYELIRITAQFAAPTGAISGTLHGLLSSFDDAAGVCRLSGLLIKPPPEESLKAASGDPFMTIVVNLTLGLATQKPAGGGS